MYITNKKHIYTLKKNSFNSPPPGCYRKTKKKLLYFYGDHVLKRGSVLTRADMSISPLHRVTAVNYLTSAPAAAARR